MATATAPPQLESTEAAVEGRARQRNRCRRFPLLTALLFTVVVTQVPFILTLWYSFQSWSLLHPATKHFAGLANYAYIFTDPGFRTALLNTVILTVVPVLLSL